MASSDVIHDQERITRCRQYIRDRFTIPNGVAECDMNPISPPDDSASLVPPGTMGPSIAISFDGVFVKAV